MSRGLFGTKNRWMGAVSSLILCFTLLFSLIGPLATGSALADEGYNSEADSIEPFGASAVVDWPMFHFNLQNTGTTTEVVTPPLEVNWTYAKLNWFYSSPAVSNGVVYTGSDDDNVYALNASTGTKIWNYTTGSNVRSSPAVSNGIVYIGSMDHKVYALNAITGAVSWNYTTGHQIYSNPVVSRGVVYIGSQDGKLYALNATTGTEIWTPYTTGGGVYSSPAVSGGIVYVGSQDNKVYALNATTGIKMWNYTTGSPIDSSPAVSNGIVYIGSNDNKVYALNATTGAWIWEYSTGDQVRSSPAVSGGIVYVGSENNNVYALNATTGSKIWNYTTGLWVFSSSPAVSDGVVYVGSADSYVRALNATTGAWMWEYSTGAGVYSSPAVSHGMVYVGSLDNTFYAFSPVTLYTVTFDTVPASTGAITFDSVSYNDGDTTPKAAQTYGITANPAVYYNFTRWETEGGVSVGNPNAATTTCTVSADGTLRMVQTAIDTDGDGMPDWWEDANGLDKNLPDDAAWHNDTDDLTNLEEYQHRTKPDVADTDGGGIDDGDEVDNSTDPLNPSDDYTPDLTVSNKYEQWMDFEAKSYNVTYTITNRGTVASGACHTRVYIDAGRYDNYYVCPALAAGASYNNTVGPFVMVGDSDNILVFADPYTAVDESREDNNSLQNVFSVGYDIDLVPGWNMVSLPLIPSDTDSSAVISAGNLASGNINNVSPIYLYDTATAVWDYWVNGAGTLTTMEDGPAYWIFATVADTLTVYGTEAASPSYPVLANWNMTGFTSITSMPLTTYLASVAPNYDVVYRWNAVTSTWSYWTVLADDFDAMDPGCGYWVHMITGGTITPP